ncbi:GGDEF domain-containing protein [Desulfosudis oleivorans]|uniref:diguanylate cyclase n=1 Tax=Desulfosudis oleivorans (strain DSM 6200 / JCM 39069 / Hxd3) TaxID=96561 RepID=A8ZV84_DESOH|nr:sensor domain-containing diguanylate cyclase [Desulfosudis oleivorans]ABW66545.1 diguanylate cyclase with GAF sensor [Desulfosudis oleivorans Hxd3]
MNDEISLYQRLRENEETAKKFYEVEKKILSILRFKDLFDALLAEIKGQFNLPYVWLSIIENSEAHHLIESIDDMDPELKASINIIDRSAFFALIGQQTEPILANDGLKPFFKLLPADRHYLVKSMAIAPIMMDGEIVGSLNQGDAAQDRFEPGMDTSLLEQLATKVSLCLSNVAAHEKLKFLAYHDPLTGLLNRRVMETALARETARAGRYNLPLSVVFLDLDYFKKVNDTHGHETGDALLKHLADQLVHQCRGTDIVARFAGDEFVIILPETDADHATALMHRIQEHLAASPLVCGETPIPVVITFGVASTMDPDPPKDDPAALLKKADERLYEKKAARQNKEGRA